MSDHDRGAYTPNNDAPLSFDARQSRGRRAFPTTLLISLVVLAGLGVMIFMFYRSGVRGAGEAPVPVGSPVGEIKAAPSAQGQQPADPAQGLQIYKAEGNAEAAASSAPTATFAPPPEQPQPRPVPTAPVAAQPIAPAAPAKPAVVAAAPAPAPKPVVVATAPVHAVPVAAAPAPAAKPVVAAAKPALKDDVAGLLSTKSAAQAAAIAPTKKSEAAPAPNPSVSHGAAVVQFGAFSSAALASSEWAKLAKAYGPDMAGKGKLVESVDRDGKTLYRGAVSGFASKTDAVAFCAKLKTDGKACIVK